MTQISTINRQIKLKSNKPVNKIKHGVNTHDRKTSQSWRMWRKRRIWQKWEIWRNFVQPFYKIIRVNTYVRISRAPQSWRMWRKLRIEWNDKCDELTLSLLTKLYECIDVTCLEGPQKSWQVWRNFVQPIDQIRRVNRHYFPQKTSIPPRWFRFQKFD